MNSAEIEVQTATFLSSGKTMTACAIATSDEDETLTVTFDSDLPVGSGQVKLDFTGILNDKLRGFYRSSYTGENSVITGEKKISQSDRECCVNCEEI